LVSAFQNSLKVGGIDRDKDHPIYSISDIEVPQSFIAKDGARIVALSIGKLFHGEDMRPDYFADQVFFVDSSGTPTYLGHDLRFLDAGDYAGTGHSAVVLTETGDAFNGYIIVWGGRFVQTKWHYH
jgi:hypothetical protein